MLTSTRILGWVALNFSTCDTTASPSAPPRPYQKRITTGSAFGSSAARLLPIAAAHQMLVKSKILRVTPRLLNFRFPARASSSRHDYRRFVLIVNDYTRLLVSDSAFCVRRVEFAADKQQCKRAIDMGRCICHLLAQRPKESVGRRFSLSTAFAIRSGRPGTERVDPVDNR